jgi:hypothetical protein
MGISVFRNHTDICEVNRTVWNWACSHLPRHEGVQKRGGKTPRILWAYLGTRWCEVSFTVRPLHPPCTCTETGLIVARQRVSLTVSSPVRSRSLWLRYARFAIRTRNYENIGLQLYQRSIARIDVRNRHGIFSVRRTCVILFSYLGRLPVLSILGSHSRDNLNKTILLYTKLTQVL